MDSGIPICQKVENLQHPECTARHRITKHSHWLVTYCDLGIVSKLETVRRPAGSKQYHNTAAKQNIDICFRKR